MSTPTVPPFRPEGPCPTDRRRTEGQRRQRQSGSKGDGRRGRVSPRTEAKRDRAQRWAESQIVLRDGRGSTGEESGTRRCRTRSEKEERLEERGRTERNVNVHWVLRKEVSPSGGRREVRRGRFRGREKERGVGGVVGRKRDRTESLERVGTTDVGRGLVRVS